MLSYFSSLALTALLLSAALPVLIPSTSVAQVQPAGDLTPAHIAPQTSSTTSGRLEENFTLPSSEADIEVSRGERSTIKRTPEVTTNTARKSDALSVQHVGTFYPQVLSKTISNIYETVNTVSKKIERLSEDVKGQGLSEVLQNLRGDIKYLKDFAKSSGKRLSRLEESIDRCGTDTDELKRDVTEALNVAKRNLQAVNMSAIATESIRRLSNQMEEHVTATVDGFEALKQETTPHLRKIKPIQDHLQDLTERFSIFESISSKNFAELKEDIQKHLFSVERSINSVNDSVIDAHKTLTKIETSNVDEISEVKRGIAVISTDTKHLLRNTFDRIGYVKSPVENLEMKSAYFHAGNVRQLMEKANASRIEEVDSDLFVFDGYSAKLRLFVVLRKNKGFFGVGIIICPGPNDSLLKWPFRKDMRLSIFHPEDPAKNVHLGRGISKGPGTFDRPEGKCNDVCGIVEALSWDSAEKDGYIHKAGITIGVTVFSNATI